MIESIDIRPIKPGWRTGNMMKYRFGGNSEVWNRRIEAKREQLIGKTIERQGYTQDIAEVFVNTHFIALCQPHHGVATLAASPEIQQELVNERPAPLEPSWKTASMMKQSQGGHSETWNRHMVELREARIGDVMENQKISQEEAEAIVDKQFIGMRQPKTGLPVLAASEDAQQLLLEKYKITRRSKTDSSPARG